jgi:hypothetical protein
MSLVTNGNLEDLVVVEHVKLDLVVVEHVKLEPAVMDQGMVSGFSI